LACWWFIGQYASPQWRDEAALARCGRRPHFVDKDLASLRAEWSTAAKWSQRDTHSTEIGQACAGVHCPAWRRRALRGDCNNINLGYIDSAMVIIPFNLCKNIKGKIDIHEADGYYIMKIYVIIIF
jgi:hypothetical protein